MAMQEIDVINAVLSEYIPTISNVEIIGAHIHGRESCPHYRIGFSICPVSEIQLYPIKDKRYNNIIEEVAIAPLEGDNIRITARINLNTLTRTLENQS